MPNERLLIKVTRETLPKIRDRYPFVYLEHGRLEVDDSSVKWIDSDNRVIPLPIATIQMLLFGPDTSVTHEAIKVLSSVNCMAAWVGADSAACITAAAFGCNLLKTGGVDADGVGLGGEGAAGDEADNDTLYASFFGRFACITLHKRNEGAKPIEAYTVALFHPLENAVLYAGQDHLNLFGA